jgi:predicted DNA-binding transcriptional regulator YafY
MLTVTFTQEELNAIAALLDTAVKAIGIQGAKAALPIIAKLEQAVAEANKPKDQSVETE